MDTIKSYRVWDGPTRWFHWINVVCVIGLMGVGLVILNGGALGVSTPGKVALKTLHVWLGYGFALNIVWRILWAFLGNPYARWRQMLPGGPGFLHSVRSYTAAFIAGHPDQYLGHNPLGRVGVSILFLLIMIQAVTGLVLAGTDIFYPPFGNWVAHSIAAPGVDPTTLQPYSPDMYNKAAYDSMRAVRKPFALTHLYAFYVLAVAAVLHIAAVVLTELREGGSIISAMFTGRKLLSKKPADE
ncbi:cytochrome b/b6 domain-containing protein [Sinimarinibacterium sp. CAU 1509]|uniref:cytochrome b/b6 domain-containing protein n=1 Tax=Sinimarinibacterium sp. CAU 1509 TaxID=2562283 RepID=UPI0010AD4E02|nr:cytochrome b/b6 domain-containing protein [Sinimarinibacterium sp. CAU 1509]TJY58843.1 cytochrome b/b6 domain-containing protein [Sinimarinibacterium sp. CAU 1509]